MIRKSVQRFSEKIMLKQKSIIEKVGPPYAIKVGGPVSLIEIPDVKVGALPFGVSDRDTLAIALKAATRSRF
jgi:hypothetical protein